MYPSISATIASVSLVEGTGCGWGAAGNSFITGGSLGNAGLLTTGGLVSFRFQLSADQQA
jgi:hypothetical protein